MATSHPLPRSGIHGLEGICGDLASRGNPPDPAAAHLDEPEWAIRPRGYAVRPRSILGKRVFFDCGTSFRAFHSTPPRRTRCGDCITLRLSPGDDDLVPS